MTETLMRLVADFGAPSLFVILAVNCLGVPFPTSLVMLALGALIAQDEIPLLPFLGAGIAGAAVGDQLGYALGRLGAPSIRRHAVGRDWLSGALDRAQSFARAWGNAGIFLSRWLVSPLGPYVNVVAGMTAYPWRAFSAWAVAGEAVWVAIYLGLGTAFGRSVEMVGDLLDNLAWMLAAALLAAASGWKLYAAVRQTPAPPVGRVPIR